MTIRAFGAESHFAEHVRRRVDDYTRPYWLVWVVNRWRAIRCSVQSILATLTAGTLIMWNIDVIDAGTAGFSLVRCMSLSVAVLVSIRRIVPPE